MHVTVLLTKVKYLGNSVLVRLLKLFPSSVRLSSASLKAWLSSWVGSGMRLSDVDGGGTRVDVLARGWVGCGFCVGWEG